MILEVIEPYLEGINLALAFVIFAMAISVLTRLSGDLKRAWKYFFAAILLFAVHEVVGALAEFGVFEVEGLYALTEFVYIIGFFVAIVVFKRLFDGLSRRKK